MIFDALCYLSFSILGTVRLEAKLYPAFVGSNLLTVGYCPILSMMQLIVYKYFHKAIMRTLIWNYDGQKVDISYALILLRLGIHRLF